MPNGTHRVCLMAYCLKKQNMGNGSNHCSCQTLLLWLDHSQSWQEQYVWQRHSTVEGKSLSCVHWWHHQSDNSRVWGPKKPHDVIEPSPSYKTHFYALLNCTYPLLQCEFHHKSLPASLRHTQEGFCRCWGREGKKNYLNSCSFEANQ